MSLETWPQSFPGGELPHVQTEGLIIECIHTVCGANNSKVSKITTSYCMRRNHDWVLKTRTQKQFGRWHIFIFRHFIWEYVRPLFLAHGPPISGRWKSLSKINFTPRVFHRCKNSFHCYFWKSATHKKVPHFYAPHRHVCSQSIPPLFKTPQWEISAGWFKNSFPCLLVIIWFSYFTEQNDWIRRTGNQRDVSGLQTVNGRSCAKTKTVDSF